MTTVAEQLENTYKKEELLDLADQFGVDVKKTMSKPEIAAALEGDGVTPELIEENRPATEEDAPVEVAPALDDEPVVEEDDDDDENLVLVRMIRANNTYEIRGYTFKASHPFALVKDSDADFLIEVDRGFRLASPKEAREFYT